MFTRYFESLILKKRIPVCGKQKVGHLASAGIETLVHYPVPVPRQPALSAFDPAECPVADRVCREVLSLPMHPLLGPQHVDEVARAVCAFAGGPEPV